MTRRFILFSCIVSFLFLWGCAGAPSPLEDTSWRGVRITGVLTDEDGSAVRGGYVYAYGGERGTTLGPADAMSEASGIKGRYLLIVPFGSYRIVARKRASGSISGPLKNGDLVGEFPGRVFAGPPGPADFDISLRVFRQGLEGDPSRVLSTDTIVSGIVLDSEGHPLSGAHAFAYRGEFRRDPPDFLSRVTGRDGRFVLNLPGEGIYSIGARTGSRGRPGSGDLMGFWDNSIKSRRVSEGSRIRGVRLVLKPYSTTSP
ncbi:hypothetical protein BMS3Abin14_01405 [bacterium BMS3Abin14]|nr:hypothetical protein BMS3Abin14_01405 [bacterium BMS3Abin14]